MSFFDWSFDDATDGLIWHVMQSADGQQLSDREIKRRISGMTWDERLDAIARYQERGKFPPKYLDVPDFPPE